jgi:hypothetical protein
MPTTNTTNWTVRVTAGRDHLFRRVTTAQVDAALAAMTAGTGLVCLRDEWGWDRHIPVDRISEIAVREGDAEPWE